MVKEGVMDNPKIDAIFGIHINAQTEIGKIKYKSGSLMAAPIGFDQSQRQTNARRVSVERR
jgi:metal-dependent amidase/aminoacylase/carboxypeptidase family protein